MSLILHPTFVYRVPKFSYLADLRECWDSLKKAIGQSSDSFYEIIKNVGADELDGLPPKTFFTIWKYFNRARCRATPYGTFAGVGLASVNHKNGQGALVIDKEDALMERISWEYKTKLNQSAEELLQQDIEVFANSSWYFASEKMRYIACIDGRFELLENVRNKWVVRIMLWCGTPIPLSRLLERISDDELSRAELLNLLAEMINLQLLFTSQTPNIIGKDFFERIGAGITPDTPKYIIAERTCRSEGLNSSMLKNLLECVELMAKIVPPTPSIALTSFIERFVRKFDQRVVPIMVALDPEIGVGYSLEESSNSDDFVGQFVQHRKEDENNDPLKAYLRSGVQAGFSGVGNVIDLSNWKPEGAIQALPLPNSFNVMVSIADDLICLEHAGGSTANILNGRFSLCNGDIHQLCRELADFEAKQNPGVLFFDIGYLAEGRVDNINRREHIYDHQLSLLNFDTSADPIKLTDLYLFVRNNELHLYSDRYKKRLIPRFASAYNHIRSDLSLFRMLCDLQYQGIHAQPFFRLDQLIPDLNYCPRVQYKNIVVSKAKWRIKTKALLQHKSRIATFECRAWLERSGMSRYFTTGLADQTLCFDLQKDSDLQAFLNYIEGKELVELEEALLPEKAYVTDTEGRPYLSQFVLNVLSPASIYTPVNAIETEAPAIPAFYAPGSEWLYFELHCHPQRANEVLFRCIAPFVNLHASVIRQWFFIRYNDDGHHIRFRIRLNERRNAATLMLALSATLQADLQSGVIADLQIKTYRRELERYSPELMEQVELFFWLDSQYAVSLLKLGLNNIEVYHACAYLVQAIYQSGLFEQTAFVQLIKDVSCRYCVEHQFEASHYKKLNVGYKQFGKADYSLPVAVKTLVEELSTNLVDLLHSARNEQKATLLIDLVHMHINRLFSSDQRTHEMVIYYYLNKDFQRMQAAYKKLASDIFQWQ